jgi:ferredoxin
MKVWIDQDLCTGDGLCEEIAPTVFTLLDDGLAYVKDGDKILSDPGGAEGMANVPAGMEDATIESAEECPGECIFIEIDVPLGAVEVLDDRASSAAASEAAA